MEIPAHRIAGERPFFREEMHNWGVPPGTIGPEACQPSELKSHLRLEGQCQWYGADSSRPSGDFDKLKDPP